MNWRGLIRSCVVLWIAVLIPILIAIFLVGLQPAPFFATMSATVDHVVAQVGPYIPTVARNVAP